MEPPLHLNNLSVNDLHTDLINLIHKFLGIGHFRYAPLACKMFLDAHLTVNIEKITTAKSVTSSISRAEDYITDQGTGLVSTDFLVNGVVRYGSAALMEWVKQEGYLSEWAVTHRWEDVCIKSAEKGNLVDKV
jgi:hypothetical protein